MSTPAHEACEFCHQPLTHPDIPLCADCVRDARNEIQAARSEQPSEASLFLKPEVGESTPAPSVRGRGWDRIDTALAVVAVLLIFTILLLLSFL